MALFAATRVCMYTPKRRQLHETPHIYRNFHFSPKTFLHFSTGKELELDLEFQPPVHGKGPINRGRWTSL